MVMHISPLRRTLAAALAAALLATGCGVKGPLIPAPRPAAEAPPPAEKDAPSSERKP